MQQNAPFCVLLKNNVLGGGVANPRSPTAFSLSRVGMYAKIRGQHRVTLQNYKATCTLLLTNEKSKSTFTGNYFAL